MASSTPATSSNDTPVSDSTYTLALLFPIDISPPPGPPSRPAIRRIRNIHTTRKREIGTSHESNVGRKVLSGLLENTTSFACRVSARLASTRFVTKWVLSSWGSLNSPRMTSPCTTTSDTDPSSTSFWNSL